MEARHRSDDVELRARGKGAVSVTLNQPPPLRLSNLGRTTASASRALAGGPDGNTDGPAIGSLRATGTVSRKRSRDESAPVTRVTGESSSRPPQAAVGDATSWTAQLVKQNVCLQRDMALLRLENEELRSRSGPVELVRLRRYAEERDAKVRELDGLVGQEVDLRCLAELKYEDLKKHLNNLELANTELVEHVRAQMSRLRASRRDYGLACARSAAEQTHARLAELAQASLTRARQYFLEQGAHLGLISQASQVKTQLDDLDLMADAGVAILPEDRARVQTRYDELVKEIEGQEMMDFHNSEYTFTPGPCLLPSSLEVDCPTSPLGAKEFGIKEAWAVKAFSTTDSCPPEGTGSGGESESSAPAR